MSRLRQRADVPVPRVPDAPPDAVITIACGDDRRGLLSGPSSSSCRGLISSGDRSGEAAEEEEAGGRGAPSSSSSTSGASVSIQPPEPPSGAPDLLLVPSATRSSPRCSFCPFRLLALPPEERDRKGITGTLSLFSL